MRRDGTCQEETEQDREARALEQVAERAEAKVGRAGAAVVAGKAEAASGQGREETAFVPAAVKRRPTNWEPPVMTGNVPNAGHP